MLDDQRLMRRLVVWEVVPKRSHPDARRTGDRAHRQPLHPVPLLTAGAGRIYLDPPVIHSFLHRPVVSPGEGCGQVGAPCEQPPVAPVEKLLTCANAQIAAI